MGAPRPFFLREGNVDGSLRQGTELSTARSPRASSAACPESRSWRVELSGPERFTVFVDHPQGVDHALCERVTDVLRDYLSEYAIDVSSPGTEPPLRRRPHFERAVGRKVAAAHRADRRAKRFRGELVGAGERTLRSSTRARTSRSRSRTRRSCEET